MKWLEEIRIKTQPRWEDKVRQVLREALISSIILNKELRSAGAYSHHSTSAGFTLVLTWETASIPVNGSETAMLIIEGIRPLGLIDHTVLVDIGKATKNNRVRETLKDRR